MLFLIVEFMAMSMDDKSPLNEDTNQQLRALCVRHEHGTEPSEIEPVVASFLSSSLSSSSLFQTVYRGGVCPRDYVPRMQLLCANKFKTSSRWT